MKPTINKPKVFISYAWGDDMYQEKIRSFATFLMDSGIDVVLDQWCLNEGNDTYKFMEQSVTDQSITNVLILLDENYTKKANDRKGGVGTETQIITPELYNKANQTKFIPIIFEKKDNQIYCPAYLKSLLYVDLSDDSTYENNLKYLVRLLYGIKTYKKPELGFTPDWVENENTPTIDNFLNLNFLKSNISVNEKINKINELLNNVSKKFIEHNITIKQTTNGELIKEDYFKAYKDLSIYKNEAYKIINASSYLENIKEIVAEFLENIFNGIPTNDSYTEIKFIVIHEMFLHILGHFYKIKSFDTIGYLLSKTYFIKRYNIHESSFSMFYCTEFQNLDNSINYVNKTNKLTAIGDYWISNLNADFCDKESLIFVDLLLNIFSQTKIINNINVFWFPWLYIYDLYHNSITSFAFKLKSKNECLKIIKLFNLTSINEFKKYFLNICEFAKDKRYSHYGYPESFESIPILSDYIKEEEIGMYN